MLSKRFQRSHEQTAKQMISIRLFLSCSQKFASKPLYWIVALKNGCWVCEQIGKGDEVLTEFWKSNKLTQMLVMRTDMNRGFNICKPSWEEIWSSASHSPEHHTEGAVTYKLLPNPSHTASILSQAPMFWDPFSGCSFLPSRPHSPYSSQCPLSCPV